MRVGLVEHRAVDVHLFLSHLDRLAGQPDDALDEVAVRLFGILEHDDIKPPDRAEGQERPLDARRGRPEGEKAELRFLRDTLGREADFVVLRKGKPWMLIEVQHAESPLSRDLRYFAKRLSVPYVFQLSWQAKSEIVLPSIEGSKVRLTSVARFLASLP